MLVWQKPEKHRKNNEFCRSKNCPHRTVSGGQTPLSAQALFMLVHRSRPEPFVSFFRCSRRFGRFLGFTVAIFCFVLASLGLSCAPLLDVLGSDKHVRDQSNFLGYLTSQLIKFGFGAIMHGLPLTFPEFKNILAISFLFSAAGAQLENLG